MPASSHPRSRPRPFSLWPYFLGVILIVGGAYFFGKKTSQQYLPTIGLNIELSGEMAAVGESSRRGAELAVKKFNQQGGIQVKLDIRDNQSNPQAAAEITRSLAQSKAMAMVGPNPSALAIEAAQVAEANQLLMISPWSTAADTTLNPDTTHKQYVYRAAFLNSVQGKVGAQFALRDLNTKRAAVLYDQTNLVLADQAGFFHQEYAFANTVTTVETFKSGDTDFSSQLQKMKNTRPDIIFLPAYYQDASKIIQQARAMGITTPFLGSDAWGGQQIMTSCGQACQGNYLTAHFTPDSASPLAKQFVADFTAEYEGPPDDVAALTYDSVGLLLQALATTKKDDRAALHTVITSTQDYLGVTGPMRFETGNGDPIKYISILKIDQNQLKWQADIQP